MSRSIAPEKVAPRSGATFSAERRLLWGREGFAATLFLLPTAVGFLIFIAGPLVAAVGLAFYDYDLLSPPRFVGLANFAQALADHRLFVVYRNTVVYVMAWTLIDVVLGLALALGITRTIQSGLRYVFRTTYFFPVLTSTASVAIIWSFLYNTDLGIINYYLVGLGLPRIPWLTSSVWSIWSIVVLQSWKSVGFAVILFVAGLQNIPRHLYEAAAIDGAGRWASFTRITLPMLSGTMFFVVVIDLINGFQIFDAPYIMTNGGPGDSSRTVVMYIYENGFRFFHMGYASTVALTLFVIILVLTIVQFQFSRSWVFYQ